MSTTTQPPKPKRRWYQFSLLTLMVVVTLATVAFGGWVQYRRHQAQVNRDRVAAVEKAVAEIEKLGRDVKSERYPLRSQTWLEELFNDPGSADDPVGVLKVVAVRLEGAQVTDAGLEHLKELTDLEYLYLFNTKITDAGLEHLKGLTKLESLYVYGSDGHDVTDAGIEHLTELTNLENLHLNSTKITDAGLEHLKGLTKLKSLHYITTNVTDAGMEHLKGLTNLEELNLGFSQVSDAGLEHLEGLKSLQVLKLIETNVTDAGVKKLQQALPNCKISR